MMLENWDGIEEITVEDIMRFIKGQISRRAVWSFKMRVLFP